MHNGGTAVPKVLPLSHPAPKQHFSEKLCQMKYKNECLLFLAASVVKLNPKHTAVIIIRLYPYLIAMDIADAACFSFAVFMILLHVSPADVAMYCHCAVFVRAAVSYTLYQGHDRRTLFETCSVAAGTLQSGSMQNVFRTGWREQPIGKW